VRRRVCRGRADSKPPPCLALGLAEVVGAHVPSLVTFGVNGFQQKRGGIKGFVFVGCSSVVTVLVRREWVICEGE
jgi:hypothetical protein